MLKHRLTIYIRKELSEVKPYDNNHIRQQWNALLKSLPPSATIDASFKVSNPASRSEPKEIIPLKLGEDGKIPPLALISSTHGMFSGVFSVDMEKSNDAFRRFPPGIIERIKFTAEYKRPGPLSIITTVNIEGAIYFDGTVEMSRKISHGSETTATMTLPRQCCPINELIEQINEEKVTFFNDWLADFATVAIEAGFTGKVLIGGKSNELCLNADPQAWAKTCKYKAGNSVRAYLTRNCVERTDFYDALEVTVEGRSVKVKFLTTERTGHLDQRKIGTERNGRELKKLSEFFPNGIAQRGPKAFTIRISNYQIEDENHSVSDVIIPWPDRTHHNGRKATRLMLSMP